MKKVEYLVPVHPGELIADEIAARKWAQKDVAAKLGIYPTNLNEYLVGKRNITANMALKLEAVFGISADSWMVLQSRYTLHVERNK